MLSAAQQAVAVLAYIKNRLIADKGDASLLQDPFFLANLDYNFTALFEIYGGRVWLLTAPGKLNLFADFLTLTSPLRPSS